MRRGGGARRDGGGARAGGDDAVSDGAQAKDDGGDDDEDDGFIIILFMIGLISHPQVYCSSISYLMIRHEHVGRGGVDAGGDQDVGALLLLAADGCVLVLRRGFDLSQVVCLSCLHFGQD